MAELRALSPIKEQPQQSKERGKERLVVTTKKQLVEDAAKSMRGGNICMKWTAHLEKAMQDFWNKLEVDCVEKTDPDPTEVQRTVIDIYVKDYVNRSETEDESSIKISKSTSSKEGRSYLWSTTSGSNWNVGASGKLAASKLLGMGVGAPIDIDVGVEGSYGRKKERTKSEGQNSETELQFHYDQEEKITVPPKSTMRVKVLTSSVKYEKGYTVRWKLSRNEFLPVHYYNRCFGCIACSWCSSTVCVTPREVFRTLPGYRENTEEGTFSFTQDGKLTWIGEGYDVEKTLKPN